MRIELVAAGRELLEDGGLQAVTVREVARRCGVSHGAPRRHYPTLASLLADIAATCLQEIGGDVATAGAGLHAAARAYVAYAVAHPHAFDLITRHDLLAGSGRQLRATSLPLLADWQARYAAQVPDAAPAQAVAAWAALHGVASLAARNALDVLGVGADELLAALLPREEHSGTGHGPR